MNSRAAMLTLIMLTSASCAPAFAASACDTPEHRAFDFWLGDWMVTKADGKPAGINHISAEYDGCVVHERYDVASGYRGESLNIYDVGRKLWHQTWVDNSGLLLRLEGGLREGSMVLEGQTTGADGQITLHRITWTPHVDGSVRQLWQSTNQDGLWQAVFEGRYEKMP